MDRFRKIGIVAGYTLLEGVRARFFVGVILVSVVIVLLGTVLASFPYGQVDVLMAQFGWGAITLAGLAISTLFAINYLYRERDVRVLNLMLTKPLARWEYGLGKFVGIWILTAVTILIEGFLLVIAITYLGGEDHQFIWEWLTPSLAIIGKCGVLLAYALLFATLLYPLAATIATFAIYLIGVGSEDFMRLAENTGSQAIMWFAESLRWIAPQFGEINVSAWVIHRVMLEPAMYSYVAVYLTGYIVLVLSLFLLVFELKELK